MKVKDINNNDSGSKNSFEKLTEELCFYLLYSSNIDEALQTYELLDSCDNNNIRWRLIVFIVICYIRPFSGNEGFTQKQHKLPMKFVPKQYHSIHKQFIEYRNCVFAHTDVVYRQPKLSRIGMSARGVYYDQLNEFIHKDAVVKMLKSVKTKLEAAIVEIRRRWDISEMAGRI